jgi:hypothetical protein
MQLEVMDGTMVAQISLHFFSWKSKRVRLTIMQRNCNGIHSSFFLLFPE